MTASAFLLATTMGAAQAQTSTDDDTMQQGQQQGQEMMGRDQHERKGGKDYRKGRDRHADMMRRHHSAGGYGMHRGMHGGMGGMGGGMGGMGHRAMMQVLFAVVDANGDGTLSLEEVQETHARIFAHMDEDGDGQLTKGEIRDFFRGGKRGGDKARRDRSEMSEDSNTADTDDDNLNLSDDVEGDDNGGSDN